VALIGVGPFSYRGVVLPDEAVVAALKDVGARILRTDEDDALCSATDRAGREEGPGGCAATLVDIRPLKDVTPLGSASLSAVQIEAGTKAIAPAMMACMDRHGEATTKFQVESSGKVSRALVVSGSFVGTEVAACIEQAARKARFRTFDGPAQSFTVGPFRR
jgi:hypothetical protein